MRKIYSILKRTEHFIYERYPAIRPELPEEITFVHAEELRAKYPKLTPKQREHRLLRECGAAFIIGIGGDLGDGTIHDGRAPDYDDWSTPTPGRPQGTQRRHPRLESGAEDGVRAVLDGHPRGPAKPCCGS